MTDKPIIKLKPMEDLDEKIIKEKGNTKCIFYSDNICRKGDKTRDCVNCARVEYHSLYSLNLDNQERLQKIINQKEKKCKELKKTIQFQNEIQMEVCGEKNEEIEKLKAENEELERLYKELQDDMLACNKCRTTIKLQQQLNQLKADNETLFKALEEVNKINKRLELKMRN